jgi:hypothetical protein
MLRRGGGGGRKEWRHHGRRYAYVIGKLRQNEKCRSPFFSDSFAADPSWYDILIEKSQV